MKVSLVIPARNEAAVIADCLKSLAAQIRPPDEVILVDNSSLDKTVERAKAVGLGQLKVLNQPIPGIAPSRSAGFDAAKGDIIARIDADTTLPTGWVKTLEQFFTINKGFDAITGPAEFRDFPKIVRPTITKLHTRLYFGATTKMLGFGTLWGSNMAITRSMWLKVRDKVTDDDSLVHEDIDLAIQIHRAGGKIAFDPGLKVSVLMRQLWRSPKSTYAYIKKRRRTIELSKK